MNNRIGRSEKRESRGEINYLSINYLIISSLREDARTLASARDRFPFSFRDIFALRDSRCFRDNRRGPNVNHRKSSRLISR